MTNTEFDVAGKVALVTGASSGFGRHFAKVLAGRGANVVVAARREQRLVDLVAEIEAAGGSALAVAMDVTQASSIAEAFNRAAQKFGTVTIVANNAGVADTRKAVDIDEANWDYVIDSNLKGAWLVAQEAGRRMIEVGKAGSIVNTASILGLGVANAQASYAISKAGVVQMTKALALEWARKNIRVNAICPGYFLTEINNEYFETEQSQRYIDKTPAQRVGNMDEITAPFLLLASDAGSFINGVALPVDGGHLVRSL